MPTSRDPKRPLLIGGVLLMAVGGALEIAARAWKLGGVLDTIAPWIVLVGSIVTLLYFVVRRAASAPPPDKRESALFDPSTQMDDTRRD